ncbi:hypothetical protein TNCV_1570761 [Trichonephila clavipes]|uniref:Uncharacterized protein n=1 Tax=Trichonephila clavipes TaxID=2585209 RepID=A0A8X6SPD7_TRICX|nr:hypothetical protein TNCV_1570761 [Trichonephila clavipes]
MHSWDLSGKTSSWFHFCIKFCSWTHYCPSRLYYEMSTEATIMVSVQSVLAAPDVVALSVLVLVNLQTSPIPDSKSVTGLNDPAGLTLQHVFSLGRGERPLMVFGMFLLNLSIPCLLVSRWILTKVRSNNPKR